MTHSKSPWAFGLVRNGKVVGVELTLACARRWADVDIVPLGPLPDSEQFRALLGENIKRECLPKDAA